MEREIISFNSELTPPLYGLPPAMQNIIRDVAKKRQAPLDFALGPAIGAASIAIGSRVTLDAYGYRNFLNMWVMMVGRSTTNKSVPLKDIYAPLYTINNQLFETYSAKVEEVKAARTEGNEKPMPKTCQILIEDSTPEARNQALCDNPHGLLNSREELSGSLGDIGRYGNSGEMGALLSLRDCTPFTTNRKSEGLRVINNSFYSWVGGIQPGMLKPTFENPKFMSMGFLNRFLVFYPSVFPERKAKRTKEETTVEPEVVAKWAKLISDTYYNMVPTELSASADAMEVYCRFVDNSYREDESAASDYEASVWGKLRIYVLQLAGIACVMNAVEHGVAPSFVTAEQMSWAVDVAYYSQSCQQKMMKQILGNVTPQLIDKKSILQALQRAFPDMNKSKVAEGIGVDPRQIRRWTNE